MSEKQSTTIGLKAVSTLNQREHWSRKAKRAKIHRRSAHLACIPFKKVKLPIIVTFTRYGIGKLDSDNLQGAFKSIRDGVADWLKVDDASPDIEWKYQQEKGEYAVKIEIEEV